MYADNMYINPIAYLIPKPVHDKDSCYVLRYYNISLAAKSQTV